MQIYFWEPNLPWWAFTGLMTSGRVAAQQARGRWVSHLTSARNDTAYEPWLPCRWACYSCPLTPASSTSCWLHGLPQPLPIIRPLAEPHRTRCSCPPFEREFQQHLPSEGFQDPGETELYRATPRAA